VGMSIFPFTIFSLLMHPECCSPLQLPALLLFS
jgi:hypothetical protein